MRTLLLLTISIGLCCGGCQKQTRSIPESRSQAPQATAEKNAERVDPAIRIRNLPASQSQSQTPTAPLPTAATTSPDTAAKPKIAELPGAIVNLTEGYVQLQGNICLREGLLELIATVPAGKEHESIVSLKTVPSSIHAGLLMLGLKPGKPGSWTYTEEKVISVDPTGDRVRLTLRFEQDGEWIEKPISHFVLGKDQKSSLPSDEFVFAGSHVVKEGDREIYVADQTGDIIALVTFGTSVLAWPKATSDSNEQLFWLANPKTVPPLGTPVQLRIYPVKMPSK